MKKYILQFLLIGLSFQLNTSDYADDIYDTSIEFWRKNGAKIDILCSHGATIITKDDALIIEEAVLRGLDLKKAHRLNFFETEYNILSIVIRQIKTIIDPNPENLLDMIQEESNQLIESLSNSTASSSVNPSPLQEEIYPCPEWAQNTAISIEAGEFGSFQPKSVGDAFTPESYIQHNYEYRNNNFKRIMRNNLENIEFIMDSRGDGNCGWRAFIVSALMNAVQFDHKAVIYHIQDLINNHFTNMFDLRFDEYNEYEQADRQELKNYMLYQLDLIINFTDIHDVANIFNHEMAFDYYMIMFLRYLNLLYEEEHPRAQMVSTMTLDDTLVAESLNYTSGSISGYHAYTITWGTEINQTNMEILSKATNIATYTITENSINTWTETLKPENEIGKSFVLYVPGHYRILIPKDYDL